MVFTWFRKIFLSSKEESSAALKEARTVVGILNNVLSYDRESIEDRLVELGWKPWEEDTEKKFGVLVDDLDCFNGPHPDIAVTVVAKRGRVVRFEEKDSSQKLEFLA